MVDSRAVPSSLPLLSPRNMGRWAQQSKRGRDRQDLPVESAPIAPVLTFVSGADVTWTFGGANPPYWALQNSEFPDGPWEDNDNLPGAAREWTVSNIGLYYRLFGSDGEGAVLTGISNVVLVPGV